MYTSEDVMLKILSQPENTAKDVVKLFGQWFDNVHAVKGNFVCECLLHSIKDLPGCWQKFGHNIEKY